MKEKIAELETQIDDLRAEVRRERAKAAAYENAREVGTQVEATLRGLVDSGLDEDFAKQIVLMIGGRAL